MSDSQAANILRTAAARHFEQAIELKKGQPISDPVDFSDSFYYRAIRTKIGEALRSQLVPTEPPPEKFLKLLRALDQPKGGHNGGMEEKHGGSKDAPEPPEEKSAE
jgi:hypothetical protein